MPRNMRLLSVLVAWLVLWAVPIHADTLVYGTYQSNVTQANPANPAGTASGTQLMMGLGSSCVITPRFTATVFFMISGVVQNDTNGDGYSMMLRYGTGTAPVLGAAMTGTTVGLGQAATTVKAAGSAEAFILQSPVAGLVVGTAYWFDISLANFTGGTASIANITCTAFEL